MTGSGIARAAAPLFVVFALLLHGPPADGRMRTDRLWLMTASGDHPIEFEIADTPEEKEMGLMFRAALPQGRGMLFPYGEPRTITMWMKNTFISLDMVFIRADGVVHRVEERTEPQSERLISSDGPVTAVLEIAAGEAARLGLKPGDKVRYRKGELGKP